MDPLDEIAAVIARLSYKPGYTLEVKYSLGHPVLRIDAELTDSRNPVRTVRIGMQHEVPPYLLQTVERAGHEAAVVHWVLGRVKDLEVHEMLEWFRLDGKLVKDPHAKNAF